MMNAFDNLLTIDPSCHIRTIASSSWFISQCSHGTCLLCIDGCLTVWDLARLVAFIDDLTSRYDSDIQEFSRRFYEGLAQKSPLLQAFADNLRGMYKFYDPIIASSIILSSLAFIDACLLEIRPEYQNMPQTVGGERWAQYFRIRNGIADAYAYFTFPRFLCPDISSFLQITPDFGEFICLENDLMS